MSRHLKFDKNGRGCIGSLPSSRFRLVPKTQNCNYRISDPKCKIWNHEIKFDKKAFKIFFKNGMNARVLNGKFVKSIMALIFSLMSVSSSSITKKFSTEDFSNQKGTPRL